MSSLLHGGGVTSRALFQHTCRKRNARHPAATTQCQQTSETSPSPSSSFRSLLHACGARLDECYDQNGALQVGPARRALKAASATAAAPLAELAPAACLASLGVAATQALGGFGAQPCVLAWVGSPEPGDGVASSARRLVDAYCHAVESPPPRFLDAGLILLSFATVERPELLSGDACNVATSVADSLAASLSGRRATRTDLTSTAAADSVKRLLSVAPPKSEYAQRVEQQQEYRVLARAKAEQSEKNAAAAERRRLQRGDWKCVHCGTVNFSDRRVCHMCLQEPELGDTGTTAKVVSRSTTAGGGKQHQQRPQGKVGRPR